jgi:hypothetical protein
MRPTTPVDASTVTIDEVSSFPPLAEIEHGQLFGLSLSNNTTQYTHGLHRFPAKFIPQVPAWAFDNFTVRNSVVLDPFMGSGTTLVEGLIRGCITTGLDVDPLARLIARAKTQFVDDERVRRLGRFLESRWPTGPAVLTPPMPDIANFDHWFAPAQWAELQSLLASIDEADASEAEREFLLVVFSSTLRWVSNADDQSQKTYVSGTNPKSPPAVRATFWRFFDRALAGLEQLNRKRHSEAQALIPDDGDATEIAVAPESVDLAIASPPYLDSVDYMYNMMLEYFWLGPRLGVPDRRAYNYLRRLHIGAKNPLDRLTLPDALASVLQLDAISPGRRVAAASYFAMMSAHFQAIARALKPGARYVFVVGNSQSVNGILPLHDALVRLADQTGLTLERAFGYRVRRHYMRFPRGGRGGIILVDWVLVLRKSSGFRPVDPLPLPWLTLSPRDVAH